jgi:hypothetical protein
MKQVESPGMKVLDWTLHRIFWRLSMLRRGPDPHAVHQQRIETRECPIANLTRFFNNDSVRLILGVRGVFLRLCRDQISCARIVGGPQLPSPMTRLAPSHGQLGASSLSRASHVYDELQMLNAVTQR